MERPSVFHSLKNAGLVPVIRSSSSAKVLRIVEALIKGGIPVAEVTMTVPRAIKTIEECARLSSLLIFQKDRVVFFFR